MKLNLLNCAESNLKHISKTISGYQWGSTRLAKDCRLRQIELRLSPLGPLNSKDLDSSYLTHWLAFRIKASGQNGQLYIASTTLSRCF